MYKAAQNHKKRANHFCTQIANNTDVQPGIFQNPVLIFLNEQVKAHGNILFIVTKKKIDRAFFVNLKQKQQHLDELTPQKCFFLGESATTNKAQT